MKLSVVVCTYDRPDLLSRTLDHLTEQTMPDEEFELIVVYDDEVRGVDEAIEGHSDAFVHFESVTETSDRGGLAHARNLGLDLARSEYVLFLDDDVTPVPEHFETMYETFRTVDPEPVCVGGRVVPDFQADPPGWLPESLPGLPVCMLGEDPRWIDFPEEFVIGANLCFRRKFLREEGGFPTELGRQQGTLLANEELELLRAADERTGIYYQPGASVDHFIGADRLQLNYFLRRFFWQGVSDCRSNHFGHRADDGHAASRPLLRTAGSLGKNVLGSLSLDERSRMMSVLQVCHDAGFLFEELRTSVVGRPGGLRSGGPR